MKLYLFDILANVGIFDSEELDIDAVGVTKHDVLAVGYDSLVFEIESHEVEVLATFDYCANV